MAESEDWDYSGVPPRSWSWYVEEDPSLKCPADKTVDLRRNGLAWTGDCHNPNWGGGYTIGFQTCEQFLREGPLREQMPAEMAEEIRAHLLAHRVPGPRVELRLVARVSAPNQALERVDCMLDGALLTTLRPPQPTAEEHLFFAGAVAPGEHALGAAFIVRGRAPAVAHAENVVLRLTGALELRFEVGVDGVELEIGGAPPA